jgi:hypothetical protein
MLPQKWIFIIQPKKTNTKIELSYLQTFSKLAFEVWAPAFNIDGISKIKLSISEEVPPTLNLFQFRKEAIAIFHVWGSEAVLNTIPAVLEKLEVSFDIVRVNEIVPMDYKFTPQPMDKFPVPIVLTLLFKNSQLDTSAFRKSWHQQYTPLAMSIIPLNLYIKSEVHQNIQLNINDSIDGIVEETCHTRKELLNPIRFFGGSIIKLIPNLIKISKGVNQFLDLKKIKVYYLNEYFIKI